MNVTNGQAGRANWRDFAVEPFRIFFPAAVAVGLAGVSLWPLYALKVSDFYPGSSHARLMALLSFPAALLSDFWARPAPDAVVVPADSGRRRRCRLDYT